MSLSMLKFPVLDPSVAVAGREQEIFIREMLALVE